MTTATKSTLKLTKTERETVRGVVWRLLTSEDADILKLAPEVPGYGKGLTERELDLRDWGITYGLAAGLLAAEKPLADPEARTEAAWQIALDVYCSWGDKIAPRPNLAKAIDEVIAAREAGSDPQMHDALISLVEAWGPKSECESVTA
jgi:hypothetical protein